MSGICNGDLIPVVLDKRVFNVKCGKVNYMIDYDADIEDIESISEIYLNDDKLVIFGSEGRRESRNVQVELLRMHSLFPGK